MEYTCTLDPNAQKTDFKKNIYRTLAYSWEQIKLQTVDFVYIWYSLEVFLFYFVNHARKRTHKTYNLKHEFMAFKPNLVFNFLAKFRRVALSVIFLRVYYDV